MIYRNEGYDQQTIDRRDSIVYTIYEQTHKPIARGAAKHCMDLSTTARVSVNHATVKEHYSYNDYNVLLILDIQCASYSKCVSGTYASDTSTFFYIIVL